VSTIEDLERFYDELAAVDLDERAKQRRPNTEWRLFAVTNITFYVYKLHGHVRVGDGKVSLPSHLVRNRHLVAMDKKDGVAYEDNLCFFRCLSVAGMSEERRKRAKSRPSEEEAKAFLRTYAAHRGEGWTGKTFPGVTFSDLVDLERVFDLKIFVFELAGDGSCTPRWLSTKKTGTVLNLNVFNDSHFSLILDLDSYTSFFVCQSCSRKFARRFCLTRHTCKKAEETRRSFPGGAWEPPKSPFDDINLLPDVEVEKVYYEYRIAYDIECFLDTENLPESTEKVEFTSSHRLLSVSVCSNVPGHTEPVCLVRDPGVTEQELVDSFVALLGLISEEAGALMRKRCSSAFAQLEAAAQRASDAEKEFGDKPYSKQASREARKIDRVIERLEAWCDVVPVVGFNSQKYDMNVLKACLVRSLNDAGQETRFVVKRTNSMTCVETSTLRFVDVCNFIAPGYSYDKYLRAFGCDANKGYFPYEWMDRLSKLAATELPPREAFYSSLRGKALPDEDYAVCVAAWRLYGMTTFRDFLVWYNNLDVQPMLQALDRQAGLYKTKNIDMLKDAVSLPGLAVHWLFNELPPLSPPGTEVADGDLHKSIRQSQPVMLLREEDAPLYQLLKANTVGGPSIVFHRKHVAGETRLREAVYGKSAELCHRVVGYDANALYLYCIGQEMPTGTPKRWVLDEETQTFEESVARGSKTAHGWLEWESRMRGSRIQHEKNGREVRLGEHGLPVDGFCRSSRTVFQFHGCYWHGHPCGNGSQSRSAQFSEEEKKRRYNDTLEKTRYLRSLGYKVVVKWECEWRADVEDDPEKKRFLYVLFSAFYGRRTGGESMDKWLSRVKTGSFFGLIECDIHVPTALEDKFSEMAPIFKNVLVGRNELGEHMKPFAEASGYLKRASRMLIGSTKGVKLLLHSALLSWYLSHGLVVTKIYQLFEYAPRRVFETFVDSVSEARRKGDADDDLKILADMSKLVGNSLYGKTITNKDEHKDIRYVEGHRAASDLVALNRFFSILELREPEDGDGSHQPFYEAALFKKRVSRFSYLSLCNCEK